MKAKLLAAAAVLMVSSTLAMPALAQYVGGTPPELGADAPSARIDGDPGVRPVEARVASAASPTPASGLAFTGADIGQLVALGGGMVVIGTALARASRRRTANVSDSSASD